MFLRYSFHRNIRELENILRIAFVLIERREILSRDIVFKKSEEEIAKLYKGMVLGDKSFCEAVHKPFLR